MNSRSQPGPRKPVEGGRQGRKAGPGGRRSCSGLQIPEISVDLEPTIKECASPNVQDEENPLSEVLEKENREEEEAVNEKVTEKTACQEQQKNGLDFPPGFSLKPRPSI